MQTILPRAPRQVRPLLLRRNSRTAARQHRNCPVRLTSITRCQSCERHLGEGRVALEPGIGDQDVEPAEALDQPARTSPGRPPRCATSPATRARRAAGRSRSRRRRRRLRLLGAVVHRPPPRPRGPARRRRLGCRSRPRDQRLLALQRRLARPLRQRHLRQVAIRCARHRTLPRPTASRPPTSDLRFGCAGARWRAPGDGVTIRRDRIETTWRTGHAADLARPFGLSPSTSPAGAS